jgi:hypothetical protein
LENNKSVEKKFAWLSKNLSGVANETETNKERQERNKEL